MNQAPYCMECMGHVPAFSESRLRITLREQTKCFKATKSNVWRISRQHFSECFLNVRKTFGECFARIFYECSENVHRKFLRECSVNVRKTFCECFARIFYECSETFGECFCANVRTIFGSVHKMTVRRTYGERNANVRTTFGEYYLASWVVGMWHHSNQIVYWITHMKWVFGHRQLECELFA